LGGLALGTPEYMSPEQASGETDVGVPGDVYGLACVFYEMVAGEPPLKGASPRATMAKQVTERARPLRLLRPDAPAGFERVLERAVRRSGDNLRITVQLTSTEDGHLMWSERYDRKLHDVFAIQDEIARTIVTTLRSTSFADIAPAPANRHTENVQAYGLYLRGRYAWNKRTSEGVIEGIKY